MAEIIRRLKKSEDYIEAVDKLSTKELEEVILFTNDIYYNSSKPILSDNYYDILIDFLKLKNSKSKILKEIGSKVISKNKVKLDYWLGSMDKIKPGNKDLETWLDKYEQPYYVSEKLDGISALLIYNDNNIKLFTRGTAAEGMDISFLIKYLDLPDYNKINLYCTNNKIKGNKNLIAFRGELIIKLETFEENWSKLFKNVRNTVAGLVNSKNINPNLAYDLDLVLYEVVDPFYSMTKQFKIINDLNFLCVNNKLVDFRLTFKYLSNLLIDNKHKSLYQIDGIIVSHENISSRNIKGNPEYAFAFKDIFEEQIAKTKIINIEWNISKNGNIIPTIIIEPVTIGGVIIKRTSGFNGKYIFDNKLGPKSEIELIRSGDVIPYIKEIIKASSKPQMPDNISWSWDDSETHIKINNINNKELLIKNIYYFFSTLDTKGLGEKTIEKFVNNGYDSILKIIKLTIKDLLKIDGIKEKSANNIVESIKLTLTNINLDKFMTATNKLGNGIGYEKIKSILNIYPNIIEIYKKWNNEEFINKIKDIKGWDDKTALVFVKNFSNFIIFYEEIKDFVILKSNNINIGNNNLILKDKIIVLSGFRDKELQAKIINNGGNIANTISSKTNYLIVKNKDIITDKIMKAHNFGIKILLIEDFNLILK